MKKVIFPLFLVSGLLTVVMSVMLITGIIDFNSGYIKALIQGNRLYLQSSFDKALDSYQGGLLKKPEDERLNNNSGLAAYRLNNYMEALEYYNKTIDGPEKYIKTGNSNLKLGDSSGEDNQKRKFYEQALETYKNGIIKYPRNLDLKYNYEYVKKKLEEMKTDSENQQNNEKDNENKEENQDKEDNKENQENQENQEQKNQQPNDSQAKENQQEDSNNEEGEESKEDQGSPQQSPSQSEQNKDQKEGQDSQGEASSMKESEASDKDKNNAALIQAQRVLEMLEQQEEESLKNNQEVKVKGKGTEHDW
ncbi:MAG: tetratricopeptide repeat protein [Clostridiaceae bacterium]|nr:tetratricopeptide repeat protein [Clostridiaceae bacterium]